jgi:hypothetical protein
MALGVGSIPAARSRAIKPLNEVAMYGETGKLDDEPRKIIFELVTGEDVTPETVYRVKNDVLAENWYGELVPTVLCALSIRECIRRGEKVFIPNARGLVHRIASVTTVY